MEFQSPRTSVVSRSGVGRSRRISRRARRSTTARRATRWRTTPRSRRRLLRAQHPGELGGAGVGLLGYSLAAEELGQGCASTALVVQHAPVGGGAGDGEPAGVEAPRAAGPMVVHDRKLIGGNFSGADHVGAGRDARPLTRARRVDGGYRVTGRKTFASMLEAADYCVVMAYPDEATTPTAAMILLVPAGGRGPPRRTVWDTLGMRATRSDSMVLEECWVPDEACCSGRTTSCRSAARRQLVLGLVHRGLSRGRRGGVQGIIETVQGRRRLASPSPWPIIRTCAGTWRR